MNIFHKVLRKLSYPLFKIKEREDPEEVERIYNICQSNDGICYDSETDKCYHCKCYMYSKTKLETYRDIDTGEIKVAVCPLAKWDPEKDKMVNDLYSITN